MAKTHRGKALWKLPARGRGVCPICKATRVKVLYERTAPDGTFVRVCKRCRKKEFPVREEKTENYVNEHIEYQR